LKYLKSKFLVCFPARSVFRYAVTDVIQPDQKISHQRTWPAAPLRAHQDPERTAGLGGGNFQVLPRNFGSKERQETLGTHAVIDSGHSQSDASATNARAAPEYEAPSQSQPETEQVSQASSGSGQLESVGTDAPAALERNAFAQEQVSPAIQEVDSESQRPPMDLSHVSAHMPLHLQTTMSSHKSSRRSGSRVCSLRGRTYDIRTSQPYNSTK
jgi:hypothetical protein